MDMEGSSVVLLVLLALANRLKLERIECECSEPKCRFEAERKLRKLEEKDRDAVE